MDHWAARFCLRPIGLTPTMAELSFKLDWLSNARQSSWHYGSYDIPDKTHGPGLVPELLVNAIEESLDFWCRLCGFEVSYDRPEEGFA